MTAFLIFVIKSAFALALLVSLFMAFMSRETFHRLNRYLLLGIVVCSLVLPTVNIGIESPFSRFVAILSADEKVDIGLPLDDLNGLELGDVAAESVVGESINATSSVDSVPLDWLSIVSVIYIIGVTVLLVRQTVIYVQLFKIMKRARPVDSLLYGVDGIKLRLHDGEEMPFSWFGWVVVSSQDINDGAKEILIHERTHVNAGHSWDILFVDAVIMFQWFNPLAWIMKNCLKDIHEFEADEAVINCGVNTKRYQYLIIKKAVGERLLNSIANSFNHSLTKKRITMMCKEKSKKWKYAKALYVLPVVATVACSFSTAVSTDATDNVTTSKGNEIAVNETNVFGQKVVEDSKIFLHFSWQDPDNNGKLCIMLEEDDGNVYGKVIGATDEFVSVREGFMPGYFDRPMKEVSLNGDILTFAIYADDGEFYTEPLGCVGCLKGQKLHFSESAPNDGKYTNSAYFKGCKTKYVLDLENGELTSYQYPYQGDTLRLNKQVRKFTTKSREEHKVNRMVDGNGETIHQVVEEQPQFPGGEQAMNEYFKKNVKTDVGVKYESPIVSIIVKKDGTITDARLLQSSGVEAIDNEVLRVVRSMPKWSPGKLGNENVNALHVFPVNLTFQVKQVPEVTVVTYGDKDLQPISDLDVNVIRSNSYKEKIPDVLVNDNVLIVVNDSVFSGDLDFPADRIEAIHVMELSQLPKKWYDKCEQHGKEGIVFIDLKEGETLPDVGFVKKEVKAQAKENRASDNDKEVFMVVEQQPEFPGGMQEMMKYLMQNVKYPTVARNAKTQGRVFIEFVVRDDGSISDAKAVGGKFSVVNKKATEFDSRYDELNNEFNSLLIKYNEFEYKYSTLITDDKEREAVKREWEKCKREVQDVKAKLAELLSMENESDSTPADIVELTEMNDATVALCNEALRVVESMPAWNPGMQGGRAVAVRMTLPVAFKLQ